MSRLTYDDAEKTSLRGRPWSFHMELHTTDSLGQAIDKFWYATGRGQGESVEVGEGNTGEQPVSELIAWGDLRALVTARVAGGYDYVDAPYRRMSPESLAKLAAPPIAASPTLVVTPQATAVVTSPVVVTPPPATPRVVTGGQPWDHISTMHVVREGTKVMGIEARDAQGTKLLVFTESVGQAFAQARNMDISFV